MLFSSRSVGVGVSGLLGIAALCVACGSSDNKSSGSGGSGGGSNGSAGTGNQSFGGAVTAIPGAPGCGLGDNAAFCDSFDGPPATLNRAGELDPSKWSGSRNQPQLPPVNGLAIGIGSATIPACRKDTPAHAFPDDDTFICDPNQNIKSNHLLVAVGAQNYGQNSYRIRQPFDFAGRTGKIVFDGEGFLVNQLLGWISVEITEDPIPGPSFALGGVSNDEGSVLPKNGVEIQFQDQCAGYVMVPSVGVRAFIAYSDYKSTPSMPTDHVCPKTQQGNLNHFEVNIAQNRVEVYGTDFSADGSSFGATQLMFGADVNLPFTRGYVNITVHNHATKKYSDNNATDSWIARWDNVGFDGPKVAAGREYDVPDSLTTGMGDLNVDGLLNGGMQPVTNIGYRVADVATGPADTLHFTGVDPSGMKTAKISLSAWYLTTTMTAQYVLKYRLNGGDWHDRALTAEEVAIIDGMSQGQLGQMLDVPVAELVSGDNTVEFVSAVAPQSYPPVVSNIDLILTP